VRIAKLDAFTFSDQLAQVQRVRMSSPSGRHAEAQPQKGACKVVNGVVPSCSGLGALLFNLPVELRDYILKIAISLAPGVMSIRRAYDDCQTSWRTLASLRLVHKRIGLRDVGLNVLFYEATLRLWMQRDRVSYLDACVGKGELRRMQERDRDALFAIQTACGRDKAAWKRTLAAYKACKDLPVEPQLLTP